MCAETKLLPLMHFPTINNMLCTRTSIKNSPAIILYCIVDGKMWYSSRTGMGGGKKRNNRTWLNLQPLLSPQIVVIRTDDCAERPVAVIALYVPFHPHPPNTDGRQQLDIIIHIYIYYIYELQCMTMALHPSPRARPEMNVVLCIFMMDQFRRPYEIYI